MPRSTRTAFAGAIFHVVNRGVERRRVFFDDRDYARFMSLLREGKERAPVKVIAFCLMPNHFHIMIEPETKEALGDYMHWNFAPGQIRAVLVTSFNSDTGAEGAKASMPSSSCFAMWKRMHIARRSYNGRKIGSGEASARDEKVTRVSSTILRLSCLSTGLPW
jgi:REP element-mobilizing transposase RayT